MNGTIVYCNHRALRYVVQLEDGAYSAFDLMDAIELTVGQIITGDLDTGGREDFTTEDGEAFSVSVEIPAGSRVSALAYANA